MPRKTLADEVRGILRKQGPSTCDEILAQCELANSRTQLANNLYQMSRNGTLRKEREGNELLYRLPTEKEQKASDIESERKASQAASKKKSAASSSSVGLSADQADQVIKALEALEEQVQLTQNALDTYLASVSDPKVLSSLQRARDRAVEARFVFRGKVET